ncbi:MAG: bifunctional metallophosphatase/5'-nucleotidase [Bacteroidales bacterium]|nr:bifunctional metallophosphatase/5'-nucleotidase [Bacteroidales bacterium]
MKIGVNNISLELHYGAKVKDAVLKYYSRQGKKVPRPFPRVEDGYGNRLDPEGGLDEGNSLFIRPGSRPGTSLPQLLLTLFLSGLLSACGSSRKAVPISRDERQVVIFAVNDMHAAIDNFPKFAYIADSLRVIYPDMLLVGSGDNQTGNPVNDQYPERGLPMIELMNATGFNLSAVGNHEFDSSPEGFSNLIRKADFDFICANMSADNSDNFKIEPWKIITLPNGLKLAFLGLLQINRNGIPDSHPEKLKGFSFRSPFEAARDYFWLKEQSDIFIALTHIGFENDVKLAETMPPGIDLIIGGHSHTRVEKEQIHNGIMITQAENKLNYGTLIRLSLKDDGTLERSMRLISIRKAANENPSIRAMVDKYNDNPLLREVIAWTDDGFSSKEELGYLMADAQRDAAAADIALVNPGGVRIRSLEKGPVRIMDVYQLDPFGNDLIVTRLTGEEIHSLMLSAYPMDDSQPVFSSGIFIVLKPGTKGELADVTLLTGSGAPLDMNKTYTVAMNSYMTQVYRYQHNDPGQSLYISTADALISYLKKNQNIRSYRNEKRFRIER